MKLVNYVVLAVLVLLAVSSGVTKIMLMQQDVEFFGQYGFTNPILIAYGIAQLVGGVLLILPGTRAFGAVTVAATFLVSAAVLLMAGKILLTIITLICILLLAYVARQSRNNTVKAA